MIQDDANNDNADHDKDADDVSVLGQTSSAFNGRLLNGRIPHRGLPHPLKPLLATRFLPLTRIVFNRCI